MKQDTDKGKQQGSNPLGGSATPGQHANPVEFPATRPHVRKSDVATADDEDREDETEIESGIKRPRVN